MKERPILFSGPMVRAILEGRKTQTRRVALYKRVAPPAWATWVNHIRHPNTRMEWVESNLVQWSEEQTPGQPLKTLRRWPIGIVKVGRKFSTEMDFAIPCPYGVPGDRLWVKETCMFAKGADIRESFIGTPDEPVLGPAPHYAYRATEPEFGGGMFKWRSPIHMPRWASRLTLEIVKVRVERVQDIAHEDALAEGCKGYNWVPSSPYIAGPHTDDGELPAEEYHYLWDSINFKRGYGWDSNPWVWVVEFTQVQP